MSTSNPSSPKRMKLSPVKEMPSLAQAQPNIPQAELFVEVPTTKTYGGIEGDDSEYVTLISGDGHSFILRRDIAMQSKTLKSMMSAQGRFIPASNEATLRNISGLTLKKMIAYLMHRDYYSSRERYTGPNATKDVPDFEFTAQESLSILVAANFLQI